MNAIYIRRRMKVTVPAGTGETHPRAIAALQKNIGALGFILSPEVCERLGKLPLDKVESFYKGLVAELQVLVGAHREFRPMYPNFPAEVMQMSEADLYLNAILHYCTNRLRPIPKSERPPLLDQAEPKVISLGSREDFESIFTNLAAARTSISAQDKADVTWFASQYREGVMRLLPNDIPNKENLAVVGAALLRYTTVASGWLAARVKTATDVLRIAVALGEGDVSLANPSKFGKFPRAQRMLFLGWLEQCGNPTEDMLRWSARWVRLGERLHPGEYKRRFPKTAQAFDILRNHLPFETFNGKVERLLASREGGAAAELLLARPGELARRTDHLLRTAKSPEAVLTAFRKSADRVSTPVLLQVMAHFAHRPESGGLRVFFPKGEVAKVQAIENKLAPLSPEICSAVMHACEAALIARFGKLPPLGACYLDPRLADYLVPLSQRSASKALRTLGRGSRLPLPDCEVLRFFIWWKNGKQRTDIDLSAGLFDAQFRFVDEVAYYNLRNYGGCHSGDIVDAPQGAAEFIDLDIAKVQAMGARYIVMSVNSYTMQPYCDLPECFAGWMARESANSGEIFEPRTVADKVDLAANTQVGLPAVFDLVEKRVVWADLALRSRPSWNNLRNNLSGVSLMIRAVLGMKKPSLHKLFELHIKARGKLAGNRNEANTVFAVNEGVTPFDLDRIAAEYL